MATEKVTTTKANDVFVSNDYSRFKYFDNNRPVRKQKVNKLIKVMERYAQKFGAVNAFLGVIIVVKLKLPGDSMWFYYILDGQHRFEAASTIKIPVRFEVRDFTIKQVDEVMRDLNTTANNWSLGQYANSLVKGSDAGKKNAYTIIEKIRAEFNLPYCTISHLLLNSPRLDSFKDGSIKLKSLASVRHKFEQICEYRELGIKKAYHIRNVITLINSEGYNHKALLNEVKKASNGGRLSLDEQTMKLFLYKAFNKHCTAEQKLTLKLAA
jgi:hypothetical protein